MAAFTNLYLLRLQPRWYVAPNRRRAGGLRKPRRLCDGLKPGLLSPRAGARTSEPLSQHHPSPSASTPWGWWRGSKHPDNAIPGFRGALFPSRTRHFLPGSHRHPLGGADQARPPVTRPLPDRKIMARLLLQGAGSGGCRFMTSEGFALLTLQGHGIMQQTRGG